MPAFSTDSQRGEFSGLRWQEVTVNVKVGGIVIPQKLLRFRFYCYSEGEVTRGPFVMLPLVVPGILACSQSPIAKEQFEWPTRTW
ncbi:hypothetical protein SBDP1_680012 [Syntrophobacter sp. SbD1]|nr:hypothetical protein SBDP1_680012 [Syntrophobacter sp. SbD1]